MERSASAWIASREERTGRALRFALVFEANDAAMRFWAALGYAREATVELGKHPEP